MRKPIVAANWKMHKCINESEQFAREFTEKLGILEKAEVVICPPFTSLAVVADAFEGTAIKVGAQNCFPKEQGAYTGEVSPHMLRDIGCQFVIIGHSERRQILEETDEFINEKVQAALKFGLKLILCIGETLEQRENGITNAWLRGQLEAALANITEDQMEEIVIAYEPIWAIGTGVTASSQDAQATIKHVRDVLADLYSPKIAEQTRIQYGGSVKPSNIRELMEQPDIDGVLVGGASLEVNSFLEIVRGAI